MPKRDSPENPTADSAVRILLIRLGAIGDVVMTSPVAAALREAFPRAYLVWAVEPLSAPLVRANPALDDVIVLDRKPLWSRLVSEGKLPTLWRELREFRATLHARHFDIAIDCQGLLKSGLLAWLSGAPRRIGFIPPRECNDLFLTDRVLRPPHPTRITQPYMSLLGPLGLPITPRAPVLPVPEPERAAARDFLAGQGLLTERYAACCVSSSRPQKDWVWARWRELTELLWQREGLRVVFIGGPERRVDTLRVVDGCPGKPISAVGHLSLLQSVAAVQDAAVVIGCDTGLTYAGLATATPTVALYGSTDPTWLAEEPCVAVCFHPMSCSPCHRRPKCRHFDCMQAISAPEVADAVSHLLQRCGSRTVLSTAGAGA